VTLHPGQQVRHIGQAVNVPHGAIGTVVRMHHVLTDCPVVQFQDIRGPHDTFVITRPDTDLAPAGVASADAAVTW
jgi:hypothetical protein